MEKVALEFLDTADGQHYLEGYWVSRLEQFKKSKSYKRELAKITAPYFGHGFVACKEKLKAHGYPPPEKDPSFLDISTTMKNAPDPFLDAPALEGRAPSRIRRRFRQYTRRGRGRSEESSP
ncbi:uncharacterized protein LOC105162186 [Sesamum indicum]|uniref:Uncharacterized protein LOC105162186 n=1 Tax=Sesamum indicum TaxID=4182 RepID=A0A6I9T5T4_SESIN|nr:uncharacterized protein LOC105162186 [Sesamum indicum]